ncbi:MAG: hypothetical protein CVU56_29340 [Deltaproteobacteria bacterium HGW-Deltaproteobacteria-14]|jgi:uncharacterized membrane protein YkgB|nr:MAG: hypothetical protein CVU56_29340 [Deltaproteobacteria bacterium HGW-Deltaproteobacteria-14]
MTAPTHGSPPPPRTRRWTAIDVIAAVMVVGTLAGVILKLTGFSGGLLVAVGTVLVCATLIYIARRWQRRSSRPPTEPPDAPES